MPAEDEGLNEDALAAVAAGMATEVGSQELGLKMKLGNAGYEEWKRRSDSIEDSAVSAHIWEAAFKRHAAELQNQSGRYVGAKASMWSAVALAIFTGTLCGFAEFIRWVVGS